MKTENIKIIHSFYDKNYFLYYQQFPNIGHKLFDNMLTGVRPDDKHVITNNAGATNANVTIISRKNMKNGESPYTDVKRDLKYLKKSNKFNKYLEKAVLKTYITSIDASSAIINLSLGSKIKSTIPANKIYFPYNSFLKIKKTENIPESYCFQLLRSHLNAIKSLDDGNYIYDKIPEPPLILPKAQMKRKNRMAHNIKNKDLDDNALPPASDMLTNALLRRFNRDITKVYAIDTTHLSSFFPFNGKEKDKDKDKDKEKALSTEPHVKTETKEIKSIGNQSKIYTDLCRRNKKLNKSVDLKNININVLKNSNIKVKALISCFKKILLLCLRHNILLEFKKERSKNGEPHGLSNKKKAYIIKKNLKVLKFLFEYSPFKNKQIPNFFVFSSKLTSPYKLNSDFNAFHDLYFRCPRNLVHSLWPYVKTQDIKYAKGVRKGLLDNRSPNTIYKYISVGNFISNFTRLSHRSPIEFYMKNLSYHTSLSFLRTYWKFVNESYIFTKNKFDIKNANMYSQSSNLLNNSFEAQRFNAKHLKVFKLQKNFGHGNLDDTTTATKILSFWQKNNYPLSFVYRKNMLNTITNDSINGGNNAVLNQDCNSNLAFFNMHYDYLTWISFYTAKNKFPLSLKK